MNRQIRNTETKKIKYEIDKNEKDCEANDFETDEDAEYIQEIMEKISNACSNLTKNEWLLTYNLRVKDISEIKSTKNTIYFFKKWALYKNSSVYVLWDFQKLAGSIEYDLSQNWKKFFDVSPKYIIENIKDRKIKNEISKLISSIDNGKHEEDENYNLEGKSYY